ncbi:MAG: C4-type zinc ribbon domain-containing protein [Bacteroidota bacterium]|nr:C4-type zinc ribbon domain-containing protein [Bacteroidota bacterium]
MAENNINEDQTDESMKANTDNTEEGSYKDQNTDENLSSRFQEFFADAVEVQISKMNNALLTFLELKKIDEELTEIEEEKGDLPDSIKLIKSNIEFLETQLENTKQSLTKFVEEKSKLENENKSYEEKISKYDEQKYDVRSNKEYDEIVKTIESLFDEVGKNESRLKDLSELIDKLQEELTSLGIKIQELNTDLNEKQTHLDELNEQYKQDEHILNGKRGNLMSKLDSQAASLYERINNSYKGEATAIVRKGNCSGCYNSIPPQRVIEIKTAEKIFTCQSCGRILISEELISSPT